MCIFEADKGYDNCRSMSHSAGVGHPPKKTQHLGASASSDTVSTPLSLHFLASCFSGPVSATLVMCSLSSVVSPHPGLGLSPFVTPGLPTPSPVLMPQISRRVHLAHEDQSAYLPWGGGAMHLLVDFLSCLKCCLSSTLGWGGKSRPQDTEQWGTMRMTFAQPWLKEEVLSGPLADGYW
jgi:hypothetical protein